MTWSGPPSRMRRIPASPGKWTGSSSTKACVEPEFEPDLDQVVDLVVVVRIVRVRRGTAPLRPRRTMRRRLPSRTRRDAAVHVLDRKSTSWPPLRTKIASGTPQARCRDSTQSGLLDDHALMRFSPVCGTQRVSSIASSAIARRRLAAWGVGEGPVHGKKPLRRVAEDDRLLRAPAMRILMLEPSARNQRAASQRLDDSLIGVALLALVGEDALCLQSLALPR